MLNAAFGSQIWYHQPIVAFQKLCEPHETCCGATHGHHQDSLFAGARDVTSMMYYVSSVVRTMPAVYGSHPYYHQSIVVI